MSTRLPLPERFDRAAKRTLRADTGGAVYVEFLLAFIPLFFLFLGMVQMALLYGASLVVQRSANVAVRAAMVVMDDDPRFYDGAPRRDLQSATDGGTSSFVQRATSLLAGALPASSSGGPPPEDGARAQSIALAAGIPLLPLSPPARSFGGGVTAEDETVRAAFGVRGLDSPEARVAWGLAYHRYALSVTFPTEPGGSAHATDFPAPTADGDGGTVTARVTYAYACQVPLASRLMCESVAFMRFGVDPPMIAGLASAFSRGELTYDQLQAALRSLEQRRRRVGRWEARLDALGNTRLAGLALLGGRSRFVPISAEATMPMQSAGYCYRGEAAGSGCWAQQ
jgi:hypothetical protein